MLLYDVVVVVVVVVVRGVRVRSIWTFFRFFSSIEFKLRMKVYISDAVFPAFGNLIFSKMRYYYI